MPKPKEISLDSVKRIVDAHKAEDKYTKLSQCFQVSRTGVKSMIKKLKESHKPGRGSKRLAVKDFNDSGKKNSEICD